MSAYEFSKTTPLKLSLHTPLLDILDCKYPILCAGMGGVARAPLAAAVSEAGGFGCMGMVRESPQLIREQIELFRSLSKRTFAVNIIPAATGKELLEQQVELLIAMKVPAVCLFWDVVPEVLQRFKDAGMTVIHQIGNLVEAEKALQAGADILIVQGIDAGGHVRGTQSVYTLLPEICGISPVPVIAAGGIATGQGIAAAMMLGAQGVCCGSAFLATFESNAHSYHKQRLLDASADDTLYTQMFHKNWPLNAPVRVLRNSVTESSTAQQINSSENVQIGEQDGQPVFLYATDSPLQGATGELERMALYAGRSCSAINDLCSAADRVQQLVDETIQSMRRLGVQESLAPDEDNVREVSSSPCMAEEFNGDYSGHYDNEELYPLLLELLGGQRAVAKVCALSLGQAGRAYRHDLLLRIHQGQNKSCEDLSQCIAILEEERHGEIGDYFDKWMAIRDFNARMQLLKEDQKLVVRKIGEILPRVGNLEIFEKLKIVREFHAANIEFLDLILNQTVTKSIPRE